MWNDWEISPTTANFDQQKTLWHRMGDKDSSATAPLRVAHLWEGTKIGQVISIPQFPVRGFAFCS